MENSFESQSRGVQTHSIHIPEENTFPQVVQYLLLLNINLPETQVSGSNVVEQAEGNLKAQDLGTENVKILFFTLPKIKCGYCPGIKDLNLRLPFLCKFFAYWRYWEDTSMGYAVSYAISKNRLSFQGH